MPFSRFQSLPNKNANADDDDPRRKSSNSIHGWVGVSFYLSILACPDVDCLPSFISVGGWKTLPEKGQGDGGG